MRAQTGGENTDEETATAERPPMSRLWDIFCKNRTFCEKTRY